MEGGHGVPELVVRRRFLRTVRNFFLVYRSWFDRWKLLENDGPEPRLIAVEKAGRLAVRDRNRFDAILRDAQVAL